MNIILYPWILSMLMNCLDNDIMFFFSQNVHHRNDLKCFQSLPGCNEMQRGIS